MDEFKAFHKGAIVKIKRSSGKITEASITEINPENKNVVVEWTENNFRMEKNVTFEDIKTNNNLVITCFFRISSISITPPHILLSL